MKKLPFILSLLIHLGFFFLLLKAHSLPEPQEEKIEISFAEPPKGKQESKEDKINVIPKGDTDALGKKCENTYGGIGIESGAFDRVSKVFEGYAAYRAGIKPGDILHYEGQIRGQPGTKLKLKILRQKKLYRYYYHS